jgi:hypothetical protein
LDEQRAQPALTAEATVRVPAEAAREWFLALQNHPERYRFSTHAGFAVTAGSFGEEGSKFQTLERFYRVPLRLSFELTEVGTFYFRFRLRRPPLPIWGAYSIARLTEDTCRISLSIGTTASGATWLLSLPLLRGGVKGQIQREVEHVKRSMEGTVPLLPPD